jgi:hypothetical protein
MNCSEFFRSYKIHISIVGGSLVLLLCAFLGKKMGIFSVIKSCITKKLGLHDFKDEMNQIEKLWEDVKSLQEKYARDAEESKIYKEEVKRYKKEKNEDEKRVEDIEREKKEDEETIDKNAENKQRENDAEEQYKLSRTITYIKSSIHTALIILSYPYSIYKDKNFASIVGLAEGNESKVFAEIELDINTLVDLAQFVFIVTVEIEKIKENNPKINEFKINVFDENGNQKEKVIAINELLDLSKSFAKSISSSSRSKNSSFNDMTEGDIRKSLELYSLWRSTIKNTEEKKLTIEENYTANAPDHALSQLSSLTNQSSQVQLPTAE